MLELRQLSKSFNQKNILKDISFKIKKGETICLLGASGIGKSTLLKMIAGLDFPDRGQILFNSIDLVSTPPHLRDFGLVFQDFNLFPHLNIFENVAFGLRMRNIAQDEIKLHVDKLIKQIGLSGFENRKVNELSGGEQQRVALARALATQPKLLMFDEPLGALDTTLKADLLNQIRTVLQQAKIPAIYVTHDVNEAFAIADRILILHAGEIIRDATPEKIWNQPKYAVVAKLLDIGNVIEGEVIAKNQIQTDFGIFNLNCKQTKGEKINMLITQIPSRIGRRGEVISLKVEDVTFKQNQFEVKSRGAKFLIKEKAKVGEVIKINVKVEYLA